MTQYATRSAKLWKPFKYQLMLKIIRAHLLIILVIVFCLAACQNNDKEKRLAEKENELLQKENDLLKKELGKTTTDSSANTALAENFTVDKDMVRKAFLQYLPGISGGRKLNTYFKTADGKGYKIVLGDLNGDKLVDAVVDYGLEPTYEDNGGGGNAISEIPGLVVFLNTGKALTIADHSDGFGGNFGSRNEINKINNGVIFLQGLDYADGDPRCCPSLKITTRLVLRNNKLTELK